MGFFKIGWLLLGIVSFCDGSASDQPKNTPPQRTERKRSWLTGRSSIASGESGGGAGDSVSQSPSSGLSLSSIPASASASNPLPLSVPSPAPVRLSIPQTEDSASQSPGSVSVSVAPTLSSSSAISVSGAGSLSALGPSSALSSNSGSGQRRGSFVSHPFRPSPYQGAPRSAAFGYSGSASGGPEAFRRDDVDDDPASQHDKERERDKDYAPENISASRSGGPVSLGPRDPSRALILSPSSNPGSAAVGDISGVRMLNDPVETLPTGPGASMLGFLGQSDLPLRRVSKEWNERSHSATAFPDSIRYDTQKIGILQSQSRRPGHPNFLNPEHRRFLQLHIILSPLEGLNRQIRLTIIGDVDWGPLSVFGKNLKALSLELDAVPASIENFRNFLLSLSQDALTELSIDIVNFNRDVARSVISQVLPQIMRFTKLRRLSLINCSLEANDAPILERLLPFLTHLEALNLPGNNFGSQGFERIVPGLIALAKHDTLRALNLSRNDIGDRGAATLNTLLSYLTSVEELDLSSTRLRYNGFSTIRTGLQVLADRGRLRRISFRRDVEKGSEADTLLHEIFGENFTEEAVGVWVRKEVRERKEDRKASSSASTASPAVGSLESESRALAAPALLRGSASISPESGDTAPRVPSQVSVALPSPSSPSPLAPSPLAPANPQQAGSHGSSAISEALPAPGASKVEKDDRE